MQEDKSEKLIHRRARRSNQTLELIAMSAIVSGLIGGIIATLVTAYVAKRVGRGIAAGELRYGAFMWGLAVACLAFALLAVAITSLDAHDKDF